MNKMKQVKKISQIAMALIIVLTLSACQSSDMDESISDTRFLIGTIVSIQLFGTEDEDLMNGCFELIEAIDNEMSLTKEDSELSQVNANAGMGPYKVSEDTYYVVEKALEYGDLSKGGFDITLEPVISLWGIGTEEAAVPDPLELSKELERVDYKKVKLNEEDQSIELDENMAINLGGIAKGYTADVVSKYLKEKGITKAILNLGGNILIIGEKEKGTDFRVGLQNPFESRNEYFGVVEVSNKTVVTSGIYERNFEEDGVTYHHILNTKTGYPVDNGLAAVSVIAETSIDADALSTVLFVLGIEDGLKLVDELTGVECIYVTSDGLVTMSQGAKAITTITDDAFTLNQE